MILVVNNSIRFLVDEETYEATSITKLAPDQLNKYRDVIIGEPCTKNSILGTIGNKIYLLSADYLDEEWIKIGLNIKQKQVHELLTFHSNAWANRIDEYSLSEMGDSYCRDNLFDRCGEYYVMDCLSNSTRYAHSDKLGQSLRIPFHVLRL